MKTPAERIQIKKISKKIIDKKRLHKYRECLSKEMERSEMKGDNIKVDYTNLISIIKTAAASCTNTVTFNPQKKSILGYDKEVKEALRDRRKACSEWKKDESNRKKTEKRRIHRKEKKSRRTYENKRSGTN